MRMYYPIKCGCKKISSSVDVVETVTSDYISLTLNLKTANQSSCMTLWPMMMHHLTKFGCKAVEETLSMLTFTGILNLFCNLDHDHNRAIQSFHKTIQLIMMCHQTKFSCKRISKLDDISKSHILIIWSLTVTLTVKTANQSFLKTIWLIMMHHHTKFGSERFSDSENIIWTNIHWDFEFFCDLDLEQNNQISQKKHLTLHCDLDSECNNPIFLHRTLWHMTMHHQIKFGCQGIISSENIVERGILWSYELSLWPWPRR